MSGDSTHGVGLSASATAAVVSAVIAAAARRIVIEDLVILMLPATSSFEQITNAVAQSIRLKSLRYRALVQEVCDLPRAASRLSSRSGLEQVFSKYVMGMIRMNHVMKMCLGIAALFVMLIPVAQADEFALS